MPMPTMNECINLTDKAARIARRNKCFLDMGYSSYSLDIEHHGKNDHSSDEERQSDRARVNGLKEMGFEVIELTIEQVADLIAYELIIKRAARILGVRLQTRDLGPKPARLALRNRIFEWNESSGAIR